MTYCRYCLVDRAPDNMHSARMCKPCQRERQVKIYGKKRKKRRSQLRFILNKPIDWKFNNERIKHPVFKDDIKPLSSMIRSVVHYNKHRKAKMSLDHVVPVNNPLICGLTVSWNMQLMFSSDNSKKGNYFDAKEQETWLNNWLKERDLWLNSL